MKKQWVRLWEIAFKKSGNHYGTAWSIYKTLFLKHHQHADEIVVAFDGTPLEARYKCGDLRDVNPTKLELEFQAGSEE